MPKLCRDLSTPIDNFFEPPIPRIRISPTINQCLLAMGCYIKTPEKWNDIFVYKPEQCKSIQAFNVHDAHLTEEHWLISKTKMNYIGKIKVKAKFLIQFRYYNIGPIMNRLDFDFKIMHIFG